MLLLEIPVVILIESKIDPCRKRLRLSCDRSVDRLITVYKFATVISYAHAYMKFANIIMACVQMMMNYKYFKNKITCSFCSQQLKWLHLIMLQAVIYYIATIILTKELVTAQCTIYHFKSPGVSCEDIYNKNPESHDTSGYYWILVGPRIVYCGMNYTGSSCEDIHYSNPKTVIKTGYYRINDNQWTYCEADVYNYTGSSCQDIYSTNPATRDMSGYYLVNNNQWTYCNMTTADAYKYTGSSSCEDIYNSNPGIFIKSGYYRINDNQWTYCKVDVYNYTGSSCEEIYANNPATRDKPGYYRINDNQWTYCKVNVYNYTGSSCEEIYFNNPATRDKPGYYHINESQWTYCNMTAIAIINGDFITTCTGVGGGWRRIVNINISAGDDCPGEWKKATHSNVSFCRVASDDQFTCSSASFSTNGISYQRVCGRSRGYQKGDTAAFYGLYPRFIKTIDEDYVSGLSITYSSNPRQHIWTFASGSHRGERVDHFHFLKCCFVNGGRDPPSYVDSNYYCDSSYIYSGASDNDTYYFMDPLWDGAGCVSDNTTQPWFYRQLNQITQNDIEARICAYGPFIFRSTLFDQLELYIQ